jgi:hypothetical protein
MPSQDVAIIDLEHIKWLELMLPNYKYWLLLNLNFGDCGQDLNIDNFLASIDYFDRNFYINNFLPEF